MMAESSWFDGLLDKVMTPTGLVALGSVALGGYAASQAGKGGGSAPSGYQGGIPSLTAVRQQVPAFAAAPGAPAPAPAAPGALPIPQQMYDPSRRPGSAGRRYFTDIQYTQPGSTATAMRPMSQEEAIAEIQKSGVQEPEQAIIDQVIASNPQVPVMTSNEDAARQRAAAQAQALAQYNAANPARMAKGGIAELREGRYLNGDTDGMADKVPASIEGRQPALLSDGEFVIPADVVSHLGNGNSEAGAKVLKEMLARIRKQRTGTDKQGKQINPDGMLPA